MGSLDLDIDLESEGVPRFVAICNAISADIARGRLRPGQRLPGQRTLATKLGVHRNTVVAAYGELVSQGWARTIAGSGTVVSESIPARRARGSSARASQARRTAFAVHARKNRRQPWEADGSEFQLHGGMPDPRLAPSVLLARALGRVLRRPNSDVLDYGHPQGHAELRREVAAMLADTRGLALEPDGLLITRGSQMALHLLAEVLLRPGDVVAVESMGYAPAWDAFEGAGAVLRGTRVDAAGIDVEQLIAAPPPRAVYITPHHQYPTTATLSADRRLRLLRWAREHRVAVIEDDYDHEFHYDGRPVFPMASTDTSGSVVYVGTLSKVIAPGLRVGWLSGPPNLITEACRARTTIDGQGGLPTEAAVAELLEDGELQRHVWRSRRIYLERREALVDALRAHLPNALEFEVPRGGLALWARVDPSIELPRWVAAAQARGVAVSPGRRYALSGRPVQALRIGFARHEPAELEEAVARLARALPRRR